MSCRTGRRYVAGMRGRIVLFVGLFVLALPMTGRGEDYLMRLRERVEGQGAEKVTERLERWKPEETAVIVCDMWDLHHCKNAVDRVGQMAPRMDALLKAARARGSLIIHAPSSCMEFYRDHPARERARTAPRAANLPDGIEQWLHWIDEREEKAGYPIDHSDGGEDDDPAEHAAWARKLEGMGKDPGAPWSRQVATLEIDGERDAITDSGVENWNLLEARGIRNVILVGVHTNMCVLGRPFGLRQLARNGKNVVLMRDLTDTMYNPAREPYVSHFHGTDLVVQHVERFVCPTVTSDQILGGAPYRFASDPRKHLVFLVGEREYETKETLPLFAERHLLADFRCSFVHADPEEPNLFHGMGAVADADVLFVSVRRRTPPVADLALVRRHVAAGKPVVGIRTASHAFSLRGKPAPEGAATWEEWDAAVLGGNYSNHHGNKLRTEARVLPGVRHAVVEGLPATWFGTGGSLYVNTPLPEKSSVLLTGRAEGIDREEPVAWVLARPDGGRSFYTSLGHVDDFAGEAFPILLRNGIRWAAGIEGGR